MSHRHPTRLGAWLLVAAVAGAPGCRHAQPPSASPAPPATGAAAPHAAANSEPGTPDAVAWQLTAVERRANALQAYRLAAVQLERALADPAWTAALEQTGDFSRKPPAVVVDADETVLDNVEFMVREAKDPKADWNAWCREERATAVPGALEFLKSAAARGVTVFYVTNREHVVEEATRRNLAKLGFPIDTSRDTVLTKDERGWTVEKSPRRALVARDFRVLLLAGDDFGDFVEGARVSLGARHALSEKHRDMWGVRWIALPNPVYGSWKVAAGQ